ncbi:MAG: hypothetical protein KDD22_03285 [Bdellovibrionales bacterium]|nr:hypothetical protein [Bdellovibrionales bacterium]
MLDRFMYLFQLAILAVMIVTLVSVEAQETIPVHSKKAQKRLTRTGRYDKTVYPVRRSSHNRPARSSRNAVNSRSHSRSYRTASVERMDANISQISRSVTPANELRTKAETAADRKFSMSAAASASSKAYHNESKSDHPSYGYTFSGSYRFAQLYSFGASASITSNPDAYEETDQRQIDAGSFDFGREAYNMNGYRLAPSVSIRLPFGRQAHDIEGLNFGIGPTLSLSLPTEQWIGRKFWSLNLGVSGKFNSHKYTTAVNGSSNFQWGVTPFIGTGISLGGGFSLGARAAYTSATTYENHQVETFMHAETLNWAFLKNFSASIGHSNRAALFSVSGINYDYSLISERSSWVFGELRIAI